jgi:LysR family transcriptional regulator, glycine cleavage system transcriptional activator
MERLRRDLPPPTSLIAFEAAARLRNFTHAANELGVSQAAVSRQIQNLEDNLGVSLFHRGRRPLALTSEGLRLHDAVTTGLRQIAAVAADLRRAAQPGTVTVAASVAMTSLWLMPRVAAFREAHPDIALRVIAADPYTDPTRGEVDLAIRFGRGDWPGLTALPLFDDLVMPVAAPGFFAGRTAPRTQEDLLACPLLHLEDVDPTWIPWRAWFARHGLAQTQRPRDAFTFNAYPNMIQAAVDGQGVALGWAHLLRRELQRGDLVRITDALLQPEEVQHLTWPSARALPEEAAVFRDWIAAEARADAVTAADLAPPLG